MKKQQKAENSTASSNQSNVLRAPAKMDPIPGQLPDKYIGTYLDEPVTKSRGAILELVHQQSHWADHCRRP